MVKDDSSNYKQGSFLSGFISRYKERTFVICHLILEHRNQSIVLFGLDYLTQYLQMIYFIIAYYVFSLLIYRTTLFLIVHGTIM